MQVMPIGWVEHRDGEMRIRLEARYAPALAGLAGFSHLNVIWWFSRFDNPDARAVLNTEKPYRKGPDTLGIFATRSPVRPNPTALSTAGIVSVDADTAVIAVDWIDAEDGSPVLDLKPYTPSADRVESPTVPDWCRHWPQSLEASGEFDWEGEFAL